MVVVCCWTPLSAPLVTLVISTMTVSLVSSMRSLHCRDSDRAGQAAGGNHDLRRERV